MSVPSGAWMRPDTLQASDRPGCATSKLEIWLQALQEGLEVMDLRSDTVVVLVRTNIYKRRPSDETYIIRKRHGSDGDFQRNTRPPSEATQVQRKNFMPFRTSRGLNRGRYTSPT